MLLELLNQSFIYVPNLNLKLSKLTPISTPKSEFFMADKTANFTNVSLLKEYRNLELLWTAGNDNFSVRRPVKCHLKAKSQIFWV